MINNINNIKEKYRIQHTHIKNFNENTYQAMKLI